MRIAIAQIAPVFLDRDATIAKAAAWIEKAGVAGAALVAFGETLVPAYPMWLDRLEGARFNSDLQKAIHARYLDQAVVLDDVASTRDDLGPIRAACRQHGIAAVLGVYERPMARGGHTGYCTRVWIDDQGRIASTHRKLVPTYEERLAWGIGDGHGLVTHRVREFTAGALNCWENWMPLARAALYAQGENLHIAVWPGSRRLTRHITRYIAVESRSFVVSASCVIREGDIPADFPRRADLVRPGETVYDGGSCIAAPDGTWVVAPSANADGAERLITAEIDLAQVLRERQNFDPSGHYGRPDILRLTVDRRRHDAAEFVNG